MTRFNSLPRGLVGTTAISMSEQMRGRLAVTHAARTFVALESAYNALLATHEYYCDFPVLPFDAESAAVFQRLTARRLHIGTHDLRIAAIALANDATLVTSNRRDFERVLELRIEDWNVA